MKIVRSNILVSILLLIASSNSLAQNSPPALPPDLASAMQEARNSEAHDLAFTLDIVLPDGSISANYDPSATTGNSWRLVSPSDPSKLTNDQQAAYHEMTKGDYTVKLVKLDYLPQHVAAASLLNETDCCKDFQFKPQTASTDGPTSSAVMPHLTGVISMTKSPARITKVALTAPQPFSITPLAKVSEFSQTIETAYIPEINAIVANRITLNVIGSSIAKSLNHSEDLTITNVSSKSAGQ